MKLYSEHRWMKEEKKIPWKFIEDTNDPHHPCKVNVMNITWSDQNVQKHRTLWSQPATVAIITPPHWWLFILHIQWIDSNSNVTESSLQSYRSHGPIDAAVRMHHIILLIRSMCSAHKTTLKTHSAKKDGKRDRPNHTHKLLKIRATYRSDKPISDRSVKLFIIFY